MKQAGERYKKANGQWIIPACWRMTAQYRNGEAVPEIAELDYGALKAKEEFERIRDGNEIRRGRLMSKEEQLSLIASGFAPIRNYMENGVVVLAEKVANRKKRDCEIEIRRFFHTILKQIASGDFPQEIVDTLLDDLKHSALSKGA